MIIDWDDAYANMAHISGGEEFPPRWATLAAAFREAIPASRLRADIAYGAGVRHRLDLFLPEGEARGLCVFVHGGYWMAFDKSTWSHWAEGAMRRGFAVTLPSYTLAPEARIAEISREIGAAITHAATLVPPIRLAGHSAGGHLVTRMACRDTPLAPDVSNRIRHVLSISGLHDLRPLLRTAMNSKLQLDADEAQAESACLLGPLPGIDLTCWVGAAERPEFIRQNTLLANIWTGFGLETRAVVEPGLHHFDICAALAEPDSALTKALTGDDGWPSEIG
jgi:arylformamidase